MIGIYVYLYPWPALVFVSSRNERLSRLDLSSELGSKICRGLVLQRTMWTLGIRVQAPVFNHNLSIKQGREPFALQTFISELAMESFDESVLPRLSRWNESRSDALHCKPDLDSFSGEFTPVVRTEKNRRAAFLHNTIQKIGHIFGVNCRGSQNAQTLTGELIQNAQSFEGTSISKAIK